MVTRHRDIYLCLLLGHFFTAAVGSASVPLQCLRCNATVMTTAGNNPSNCTKKDFQVHINTTGCNANEGDDITLTCVHDLPNVTLTIKWKKGNENLQKNTNTTQLYLKSVLSSAAGEYVCIVDSACGIYESQPCKVTVKNNSEILLVICGVAALALVVIMGLGMKCKLKRDNAKHRQRREQRAQVDRSAPAPYMPRQS